MRAEVVNREAREFSFVFSRELVAGGSLSFFDLERARKLDSGDRWGPIRPVEGLTSVGSADYASARA